LVIEYTDKKDDKACIYEVDMYWDEVIKMKTNENIKYDGWLDRYLIGKVSEISNIIELGCGWGDDTSFLYSLNCNLISCDISSESIKFIHKYFPDIETRQFDLREKFPFQDETADYIVADLCLHYFDNIELNKILLEILRVTKTNGMLYVRVNSINDTNYGAGQGKQISEGMYMTETGKKRFFDKSNILNTFKVFNIIHMEEVILMKYGKAKIAWELVLQKI
jgi:ubiquinone/menaquinone biosynthesis C-methylase UbiE